MDYRHPGQQKISWALATLVMVAISGCAPGSTNPGVTEGNSVLPPSSAASGGNSPPTISGQPLAEIRVGALYEFIPVVSDPDGDPLDFRIENRPYWAVFDHRTGKLRGTPQSGDEGVYDDIRIIVSDGAASDLIAFSVTVSQIGVGSITLTWAAPTENTDGSALTDLAGYRIYFGVSKGDYPNRIVIDNPGITTYVVENLTPGTYYFVMTSINLAGVESDYSSVLERTVSTS